MKKYFLILLCAIFPHTLHAKSGFEYFGDSMQVLPFVMMAYSYSIDDMQGLKEQVLGSSATLLATHAIKQGFVILSQHDEDLARISQRPNNGSFNGFPSGHTSFAFSSVGFAHKRYGWKVALPLSALSMLTGISRIHSERHTTTQVITGAILGYGLSYLLASKLESQNIALSVGITTHNGYALNFIKAF